jgi:hypothetical protein
LTPQDLQSAAAKASPPVVYVGVSLLHISLPDWVAVATLVYVLLQTAHLIWRWYRAAKRVGAD